MGLRVGLLRIATAIRGFGWFLAGACALFGVGASFADAWQERDTQSVRMRDGVVVTGVPKGTTQSELARLYAPEGAKAEQLARATKDDAYKIRLTEVPYEKLPGAPPIGKEFKLERLSIGFIAGSVITGLALLVVAYVTAWIVAGFAPNT